MFPIVKAGQKQFYFFTFSFKAQVLVLLQEKNITQVNYVENFYELDNLLDILCKEEDFW